MIKKFLRGKKELPIIAGIAAGLYPVLFYYSRNYGMVNSWQHLAYFVGVYLLLPSIGFYVVHKIFSYGSLQKYRKYVLPFLNVFTFLFILKTFVFIPVERKIIVGIFVVSVLFATLLHDHFRKAIVLELLLAIIGFFTLSQVIFQKITYSDAWTVQPDAIAEVVFKKKPNVYFIEPDGYVSFSTLKNELYRVENSEFENFLKANNFKTYPNFHTNYKSTLASNAATFMMKHHFYDFDLHWQEVENARHIIITDNPVLKAFKRNGYETYFLSESYYFLQNRPKMGYDHCNIPYSKIPFLNKRLDESEPVVAPLKEYLQDGIERPKFFFIQILQPAHINTSAGSSLGKERERENWIERMHEANAKMEKMIEAILRDDPHALILILADHGGFVGLNYTREGDKKTLDEAIINSIFSTNLTIHWPHQEIPGFDSELKSSVNVFRVLFSYLCEDEKYLLHLQPDESFICLTEGTEPGVYKYIDDAGNYVFEKVEPMQGE